MIDACDATSVTHPRPQSVTAASTEDAWTQLIGRADIDKAVAAAKPTSANEGLPWSYEDSWPLSERQLKYLSFELLLLCPPGELESEDDPHDEAPQGEAVAELPTLSSLSDAQRVVLAEGLSEQLAKYVQGAEQPDAELPSLVRLAAGLEDYVEEEGGAEEALEARLARLLGAVGPAAERAAATAEQWMEEQTAKGGAAWLEVARRLGVQPEAEEGARAPVAAAPRRQRGRGDTLLEHARQLGQTTRPWQFGSCASSGRAWWLWAGLPLALPGEARPPSCRAAELQSCRAAASAPRPRANRLFSRRPFCR